MTADGRPVRSERKAEEPKNRGEGHSHLRVTLPAAASTPD